MLIKAMAAAASVVLIASVLLAGQIDSKTSADENRILQLRNAWNSAEQQKNTKALQDLLADSLVYTDSDGTCMNKSEYLTSVANPAVRIDQIVSESITVHSYGESAVATGMYREKGSANSKSYSRRVRFTDVWVNQNGVWQCVASQSTLVPR